MFNLSKTNVNEVKDQANQAVENVKDNLEDLTSDAKSKATDLSSKLKKSAGEAKDDASSLLANIREMLDEKLDTDTNKLDLIKATLADQYNNWKSVAQDELAEVVAQGRVKSKKVLNEQPLLALAVAVGAGALIGYVIGQSQTSNHD